ncbi:hypothetical protein [Variovorax paradoxus]|uniref:hypothetical protein n=1 Tax=Variovorax paradoxus TaxID=34073 RepID=UPI002789D187|nr:hypothetical protein [Variovorax paradoxus]MDP9933502.1 hypothetical protein [Variovorax paradoxus]
MSKISFVIHLGNHWRMFANARDGMEFLGTVHHGVAGIGALARDREGRYLQVNGDVVAVLDARKIGRALRMRSAKTEELQSAIHRLDERLVAEAPRSPRSDPEPVNWATAPARTPVVTVKKRRVAVRATADAPQAPEQAGVHADS